MSSVLFLRKLLLMEIFIIYQNNIKINESCGKMNLVIFLRTIKEVPS